MRAQHHYWAAKEPCPYSFHMVSLTRYYVGIYEIPSDKAKPTNSSQFLYPIMFCSHH